MLEHNDQSIVQGSSSQRRFLWIASLVLAVSLCVVIFRLLQARARREVPSPAESQETLAVITNSGSTNTPGFTLTILKDGSGSLTYQKDPQEQRFGHYENKTFPASTLESDQLASILTHIQDVSTVPDHGCVKSISFGSTTTITYQGKTSGDISCLSGQDAQMFQDLKAAVQRITAHI